jgi:hypothetical protein
MLLFLQTDLTRNIHLQRHRSLIRQTGIYIGSLLLMKGLVLILFYFALPSILLPFANWLLGWMTEWTQVVFVMALFPLLMNVLQVSRRILHRGLLAVSY